MSPANPRLVQILDRARRTFQKEFALELAAMTVSEDNESRQYALGVIAESGNGYFARKALVGDPFAIDLLSISISECGGNRGPVEQAARELTNVQKLLSIHEYAQSLGGTEKPEAAPGEIITLVRSLDAYESEVLQLELKLISKLSDCELLRDAARSKLPCQSRES